MLESESPLRQLSGLSLNMLLWGVVHTNKQLWTQKDQNRCSRSKHTQTYTHPHQLTQTLPASLMQQLESMWQYRLAFKPKVCRDKHQKKPLQPAPAVGQACSAFLFGTGRGQSWTVVLGAGSWQAVQALDAPGRCVGCADEPHHAPGRNAVSPLPPPRLFFTDRGGGGG